MNIFGSSNKKKVYNTTNDYDQREYHNTTSTDNSFHGSIDNSVHTLDGGAIADSFGFGSDALYTAEKSGDNLLSGLKSALGFGSDAFAFSGDTTRSAFDFSGDTADKAMGVSLAALDYYDRINSESLATAEKATHNALSFAANASKADGLDTAENMTKYLMIGFAVLGAAMLFRKG